MAGLTMLKKSLLFGNSIEWRKIVPSSTPWLRYLRKVILLSMVTVSGHLRNAKLMENAFRLKDLAARCLVFDRLQFTLRVTNSTSALTGKPNPFNCVLTLVFCTRIPHPKANYLI